MIAARGSEQAGALEAVADGLVKIAAALRALVAQDAFAAPGPRLLATTREPEVLLSLEAAAALLGVSPATVDRMTKEKPCRRRAGRRVLIERAGLLALTRRA